MLLLSFSFFSLQCLHVHLSFLIPVDSVQCLYINKYSAQISLNDEGVEEK